MTVPPALVGVDIAEVSRVARAVADHGAHYARHVMTPAERRLHGVGAAAVTACVAMKECLIKAVGGRPPGFHWHDFDGVGGRLDASGPLPELLDEAAQRLRAVSDLPLEHEVVHHVRGASGRAARSRLAPGDVAASPVIGVARWGRRGDAVIALALLVIDDLGVR